MRVIALSFLVLVAVWAFVAANDEITSLPGIDDVPFKQYAGYVNVNEKTGRHLFYWYVESQSEPSKDPLVLWLNGGPGCSSLSGMFTENGPFRPIDNGNSLKPNPYSWNLIANVVYLESPSGVGFSYSDDKSDYNVGDARTAEDSLNFLLAFFDMYPELKGREFYISGESYAGHYVPQLSNLILENAPSDINLKGFILGNPLIEMDSNNRGMVDVWGTHTIISASTYAGLKSTCSFYNPPHPDDNKCNELMDVATKEMGTVDPYDIYAPVCLQSSASHLASFGKLSAHSNHEVLLKMAKNLRRKMTSSEPPFDACIDNSCTHYLNRADVMDAIHARLDSGASMWEECTDNINYNMTDADQSIVPLIKKFMGTKNFRFIIYSGDTDSVCPTLGTLEWLAELNATTPAFGSEVKSTDNWRTWTDSDGQVGGWVQQYPGDFTFATVHNSGHMVPWFVPMRAFDFFSRYLRGEPL